MTADQLGYLFGVAICFGLIGFAIGRYKGRPALGFWLGFLIGLIGLIVIACVPRSQAKKMADAQRQYELQARAAGYPYPPQQPYQPYPPPPQQGYQPYPPADQGPYPQQPPPGQWQPPPGQWQPQQGQWQQPPPPESWEQPPPTTWPQQ
jgi:hypothetical protein